MILGVGFYGIVIGKVSQMISEDNRYKEKSREKIQDLTLFMRHYHVPRKVQREALSYYNNLLAKRLSDNDHKIISELPQALQSELQTYMNMKLISTLTVFKNCSHNCLKQVANHLQQKSYSPGDRIIEYGEIGNEMFIINHGSVDIRTEKGGLIVSLGEGKFFGETALLQEAPRNANVIASTYCDLYKLEKDDFLTIIQRFPELLKNMETVTGLNSDSSEDKKAA